MKISLENCLHFNSWFAWKVLNSAYQSVYALRVHYCRKLSTSSNKQTEFRIHEKFPFAILTTLATDNFQHRGTRQLLRRSSLMFSIFLSLVWLFVSRNILHNLAFLRYGKVGWVETFARNEITQIFYFCSLKLFVAFSFTSRRVEADELKFSLIKWFFFFLRLIYRPTWIALIEPFNRRAALLEHFYDWKTLYLFINYFH